MTAEQRPEQQGQWVPAERAEGLAQVWESNGNGHSYEAFTNRDFYTAVDSYTVDKVERLRRVLDLGTGVGGVIKVLVDREKLENDFQLLAFDIDREGLATIKNNFSNFRGRNLSPQIGVVYTTIDDIRTKIDGARENYLPVQDNWADLVTIFNTIHLLDNPQKTLSEAHRVLAPGKKTAINTAYEKSKGYGDQSTVRMLASVIGDTRRALKELGYQDIPKPIDFARFTEEEYRTMAKEAGFVNIETETYEAQMGKEDIKAIFSYDDFLEGSFPGIDPVISHPIVMQAIDSVFDRFEQRGITTFRRNWMILIAQKPSAL